MIDEVPTHVRKRKRQRSIAISDEMLKEVKKATKGCISSSGFIRMAIMNELERRKKLDI